MLEAILDSAGLRPAAFAPNSPSGRWTFRLAMAAPGRPSRMAMLPHPAVMLNTSAPLPMRLMSLPVLRRALLKLMSPARPTNAPDLPRPLRHPSEVGQRCSPADAAPCYRFYHLPTFHWSWSTLPRRFPTLTGSTPDMRVMQHQLPPVLQPTLLIWAKNDPFGSLDAPRRATQTMSSAASEVLGTGHLPSRHPPENSARPTREFVTSSTGTTAG